MAGARPAGHAAVRPAAALALAVLLAATGAAAQDVCGTESAACATALGSYRAALPEGEGPHPAVVFLHGAGGNGAGILSMTGMVEALQARGYAVLAPDGLPRSPERPGGMWSFLPETARPRQRDEAAFFAQVVADAVARFGVDPDRVVLAGFSAGGFLVNYLACETPDAFAAYAPVSGGFWRDQPARCDGPVRLFHTHGWSDGTVPLEGRILRAGQFVQGDIFEGLTLWRRTNGCTQPDPSGVSATGPFLRRHWDCAPGSALELALWPGGHGVPDGWAAMMLDWFEALPPR